MRATAWWPHTCVLCGAGNQTSPVCTHCAASLPCMPAGQCACCAEPLPAAHDATARCGRCNADSPAFDATLAVWAYAFPIDIQVQALKYRQRLVVAGWMAEAMADRLGELPVDLMLPVPLSARRLAERGFNQSVELSRIVAARRKLSPGRFVRRIRDTTPQAGLPWKARAGNLRNAFACDIALAGQHVLVIDDVMTTGATLNELARTLKAAGAARVTNLVAARTLRDHAQAR